MKSIRKQRGWVWLAGAALAALGAITQRQTNKENRAEAERNRQFQERLSNTSYQRGIQDMQAAGLNPMLAYQQGGATTPTGSMAAPMQNELGAGIASAAQTVGMFQGIQQMQQSEAQTQQLAAQTQKIQSETMTNELNTAQKVADIAQTTQGTKNARVLQDKYLEDVVTARFGAATAGQVFRHMVDNDNIEHKGSGFAADVRKRKAEARLRELEIPEAEAAAKFYQTDMGEASPHIRQLIEILRGLTSANRSRR